MLNDGHEQGLPSWKGIHTPHGSRKTFRTLAPSVDVFGGMMQIDGKWFETAMACEVQLDHTHGEAMKERTANMPGVYDEGDMLTERRHLMQQWSDLLQKLLAESAPEGEGQMRLAGEKPALAGPQGPALRLAA